MVVVVVVVVVVVHVVVALHTLDNMVHVENSPGDQ
jgi:hypothetical protein